MLTQENWQQEYLEKIKTTKRLTATEKIIFTLITENSPSEFQKKMLIRLLNNEYRKYTIQESLKQSVNKIDDNSKELIKKFKSKQPSLRKQRAHELIKIGALTELTGFTKDRGIITGVFLYMKELFEQNPELQNQLKVKGDRLITEREIEKKFGMK